MDGADSGVIERALSEAFPDREPRRLTEVGPSWNGANETVGVVFADGGRAFLKVALADESRRIARECAVLLYLRANGPLSVPTVLAADPDGDPPYLATAPAPGRGLLDVYEAAGDPERERLLGRVGAALAALHADRFWSHGEIVGAGGERGTSADGDADDRGSQSVGLAVEPASWTDVLLATIERTREIGTTERLADHYDIVVDCVRENRAALDGAPAALVHGDVTKPNLFVTSEREAAGAAETRGPVGARDTGVAPIDWELSHVGDPARDLVRAEDQLLNGFDSTGDERFAAALREGYRERAGSLPTGFERRRPVYEVVRMLGRSGFIDQWATYLDEPVDALAERAGAELRRRLDAV
ncbi:aminoglycoside phosphotransferase family protein [Halorubrum ejinorense]|uniref:Aminoglycoside phosphotransferase family protein n=1 Tax=Halorubrum ejinorense TaxID=425309 RepID=A0AAV3SXJ1_9EURY